LNEQYSWDILPSHQMLNAIKHVANENCVFKQDSTRCIACATQFNCCSAKFYTFSWSM